MPTGSESIKITVRASAGDPVPVKSVETTTLREGNIIAYTSDYEENVSCKIRRLTADESGFMTTEQ